MHALSLISRRRESEGRKVVLEHEFGSARTFDFEIRTHYYGSSLQSKMDSPPLEPSPPFSDRSSSAGGNKNIDALVAPLLTRSRVAPIQTEKRYLEMS